MQGQGAGGAACPKEDPETQAPGERAFPGLHASWVTPGVLAMARPWQERLDALGLPAQLAAAGVRLIVNLQEARGVGLGQGRGSGDRRAWMRWGCRHSWPRPACASLSTCRRRAARP